MMSIGTNLVKKYGLCTLVSDWLTRRPDRLCKVIEQFLIAKVLHHFERPVYNNANIVICIIIYNSTYNFIIKSKLTAVCFNMLKSSQSSTLISLFFSPPNRNHDDRHLPNPVEMGPQESGNPHPDCGEASGAAGHTGSSVHTLMQMKFSCCSQAD